MSQPSWAPVIYRVAGTNPVSATISTMKIAYDLYGSSLSYTTTAGDLAFADTAGVYTLTLTAGTWPVGFRVVGKVFKTNSVTNPGPFVVKAMDVTNKIMTVHEVVVNETPAGTTAITAVADRLQLWTGRYWSDVTSMTKTSAGPYAIKAWTTFSGSAFYGTADSIVATSSGLRTIATGLSADVGFSYADAVAYDASPTFTYQKTRGSVYSITYTYPDEDDIYDVGLDSTDNVYWSGGFMVKAIL